jgi:hypothetical protein
MSHATAGFQLVRKVPRVAPRAPVRGSLLQRQCACDSKSAQGGGCEECRKKREDQLQRKAASQTGPELAPPVVYDVLRSPGRPLDPGVRSRMEAGFGYDFRHVRVHSDSQAAESARAVNARAYTVGSDVVFGAGTYAPHTRDGQRLLAHELAHVVQQAAFARAAPPDELTVTSPQDAGEHEAESAAEALASGWPVALAPAAAGVARLQRQAPGQFPDLPDPTTCSIDWQAVAEGRFDLGEHLNCCAKLPIAGNTCSKDVIEGIRKLLNSRKGPGKPSTPKKPSLHCPGRETPFDTCCPLGEEWNGTVCAKPAEQPVMKCIPPEQPTMLGGCCVPGQEKDRLGRPCWLKPEPEKPPPPPPPPSPPGPVEVFFQFDRPRVGETGSAALRAGATAEGLTNFGRVVDLLLANPKLRVQLIGRASPEGTSEYNLALGQRRAEAVAAALADKGISSSRLGDAPSADLRAECQPISTGMVTCGEAGSTGPRDRQVLVRFFNPGTP